MVLIVFLYALCASSFTMCKAVLHYSKPLFFIGIRMLVAGFLLLLSHSWHQWQLPIVQRKDLFLFLQIIFFHIYAAYVLDMWSLQYLTSFKSSFFFNLAPFITALLSYWFFNERMTGKKWLGFAIGFAGFIPELMDNVSCSQSGMLCSWADIAMFGAVSSACYGWIVMRKLVAQEGYSPFVVNGIGMIGGGFLALITSYFAEQYWQVPPVSNMLYFIGLTSLIILVINVIFYNFYSYLLRTYTATFLSFAGFMCPLFAALFGVLFLHEHVSWRFGVSSLVVFCGLYLFYQEELKQGYISGAESLV